MDFITSYDIHQTYMHIIRKKIVTKGDKTEDNCLAKIEELSMLLIRMAMQNSTFSVYSNTMLVYTCIQAATTMLQLEKRERGEEHSSFFYTDFKKSFMRMAKDIEKTIPNHNKVRDLSVAGVNEVNILAEKLIEFYKIFDSWHCGLNQLKTFKKLSFSLTAAPQARVKQALDLVTQISSSRSRTAATPRDATR